MEQTKACLYLYMQFDFENLERDSNFKIRIDQWEGWIFIWYELASSTIYYCD